MSFARRFAGDAASSASPELSSAPPDDGELELDLSLGAGRFAAARAAALCRILTARDLAPLQPTAATAEEVAEAEAEVESSRVASPDSSVSSSPANGTDRASGGSKRAKAERPSGGSPEAASACGNPPRVGWPPVRTFRINSGVFTQLKDQTSDAGTKNAKDSGITEAGSCKNDRRGQRAAGWVKVAMDGELIGRKVDLNAHHSYESLAQALELMFSKPSNGSSSGTAKSLKLLDSCSEFQLTYEDKDGDWLLVGDVPWEMFMESTKRLRIMRTSKANGLAHGLVGNARR